jgi:glycosyltransferase involved in cell wall biosynthesis
VVFLNSFGMMLSIIIPIYNEKNTISILLKKIEDVRLFNHMTKEFILVDDGSKDGTRELLMQLDKSKYKIIFHNQNKGKGAAIRSGLKEASGEYVIVQDADLEYNPEDYNVLLEKIISNNLMVVYGSRQLKKQNQRYSGLLFYLGGIFLTSLTNLLFRQKLTDEATCYKLFKTDFLSSLPLKCQRFEFCPEVTALCAKNGIQIQEVPISYYPRGKNEGKKIRWRDGWEAVTTLLHYRFKK